jgi:protein-tyrosine phosphatase
MGNTMVDIIHDVHRSIRHSSDSILHPFRRRSARKRLLQYEGNSVLVVCYGNICRSPFAEAVMRLALPRRFRIQSAGFIAPGRAASPDGIGAARRFGIDLSRHCSQLLTPELVKNAGLILVMEPVQGRDLVERFGASREQVVVLGDLDPVGIETRIITDPILKSRDVYVDSYDRIDRCVREMGRILRRGEIVSALRYSVSAEGAHAKN